MFSDLPFQRVRYGNILTLIKSLVWSKIMATSAAGIQILLEKANAADAEAQYRLGLAYENGREVAKSKETALVNGT